MKERTFRIVLGGLLLIGLYLELPALLWGLVTALLFEGITNWRIPRLVSRLRYGPEIRLPTCGSHTPDCAPGRINFEAERAFSLVFATLLIASYGLLFAQLWIVPWFLGFALFGAGLIGFCPMVLLLKRLGFR